MPTDPRVVVTTEAQRHGDALCFVATADVFFRRPDGRPGSARFEFVHRRFQTQREAEDYAKRTSVAYLRKVLQPGDGRH